MTALRVALSMFARTRIGLQNHPIYSARKQNLILGMVTCRFLSTHHITKNIELISQDNQVAMDGNTFQNLATPRDRPLLIILSWLLSKRKHVMKFTNFYMEQGFDVVTVSLSPWQLIWPIKGSRLVAEDLLKFLDHNKNYQQVLLHGFSVGGYMWGEVLDLIHKDRQKYDHVVERIVGQIWDSAADVSELKIGTPRAVFPNNVMLQAALQKYLEYHMKSFHKQATQYYIRSSQLFHTNLVRSPALFLVSKTDPVGSLISNMRVRDSWDSLGVKVSNTNFIGNHKGSPRGVTTSITTKLHKIVEGVKTFDAHFLISPELYYQETYVKIFEKSPHVGHFHKHPKEYVAELYTFLDRLGLIHDEEKIRARM